MSNVRSQATGLVGSDVDEGDLAANGHDLDFLSVLNGDLPEINCSPLRSPSHFPRADLPSRFFISSRA
jgi:hypothetical protein